MKAKTASRVLTGAIILFSPLLTGACHSDFGPWPMPSGYAHHDAIYKAPPGPQPVFREWKERHKKKEGSGKEDCPTVPAQSQSMMPSDMGMTPAAAEGNWEAVAGDLLDRILRRFGKPSEPVWLDMAEPYAFGVALHDAMNKHGLAVASARGQSPFSISYSIGGMDASQVTVRMKSGPVIVAEESRFSGQGSSGGAPVPLGGYAVP